MHDFIGNEFQIGTWVAKSGSGNGAAEYGMILGRVEKIQEDTDRISVRRLTVSYNGPSRSPEVKSRIVSATSNKWVVVPEPTSHIQDLWDRAVKGECTPQESSEIGKWIHKRLLNKSARLA